MRRACRGGDEDDESRLGRVGDGGKRVRREDGQRELLREQGVVHLAARPWTADERALDGDGSARDAARGAPSCVVSELGEDRRDSLVALPCRQAVIAHRRGLVHEAREVDEPGRADLSVSRPRADARCARGARGGRRWCRGRGGRRGGSRCARRTRAPAWRAPAAPVPGQRLASSEEPRFDASPGALSEGSGISPRASEKSQDGPGATRRYPAPASVRR